MAAPEAALNDVTHWAGGQLVFAAHLAAMALGALELLAGLADATGAPAKDVAFFSLRTPEFLRGLIDFLATAVADRDIWEVLT